jgi:hypothetical protein
MKKIRRNSMNLDFIKEYKSFDYNEDLSKFFFLKCKEIEKMNYSAKELPFPGEFLFFESKYIKYIDHMLKNKIEGKNVVDIGCQYGFQSEFFLGNEYIGIDSWPDIRFFNEDRKGVKYHPIRLPEDFNLDISESIVISSMSLGYFEKNKEEKQKNAGILSKAKHLYVASNEEFMKMLKPNFKKMEVLENRTVTNKKFPVCYFSN